MLNWQNSSSLYLKLQLWPSQGSRFYSAHEAEAAVGSLREMYGLNLKGAGDLGHCGCNRMPGLRALHGQRPRLCEGVRYLQGNVLLSMAGA